MYKRQPFTLNDVDAVQKYSSKESVTRYMMWGPNKYEDTKRFVSSVVSRNSETPRDVFDFIVTLKDGTVIGACGLYFDEYPKPPTLGWVFDDTYWNQGYGTETGRALLAFGFNTLKVKSILATCDNENIASARIMEKIGMRDVYKRQYLALLLERDCLHPFLLVFVLLLTHAHLRHLYQLFYQLRSH